jgi:hypothetical protein
MADALPVGGLHLDMVRGGAELADAMQALPEGVWLPSALSGWRASNIQATG